MRNQTSFRLTTTLLPSDTTAKTTQVINKLDAGGNKFYPTFTEETIVLTNDDRTVMETTKATCTNGVLTFTKRGLSDDNTETQVDNRKLTWNPGTLAFITAGAGDWIDKDDDVVWTGKQTYTGELVSSNKATYNGLLETKKGVKYPSFENTTALEAYAEPFGGMLATVEDTGELYRYNAATEQWDLVSTVELGEYIIRASDTEPASGTADTIVTISPALHALFLGTSEVVRSRYVDLLIVGGGGGGGGRSDNYVGGGGGAGGVIYKQLYEITEKQYSVVVGLGGAKWTSESTGNNGENGGTSYFGNLYALGGGSGGGVGSNGASGGGGCNGSAGGTGFGTPGYLGRNGSEGRYYSSGYGVTQYHGGQGGSVMEDGRNDKRQEGWGGDKTRGTHINIGGSDVFVGEGGGGGFSERDGSYYQSQPGLTSTAYGGGGGGAAVQQDMGGQKLGGDGHDGVVIVAYPTDGSYGFTSATGGTITTSTVGSKTYNIHTFTSNGTFTIVS